MIVIIDGCGSNIASIQFALARLNITASLTTDVKTIKQASRIILPGVGNAAYAMQQLQKLKLVDIIKSLQQPVLGICLGMQLLFESSDEGDTSCLGLLTGRIKKLKTQQSPVPHIGWNQLQKNNTCDLLNGIDDYSDMYFVHSYCAPINEHTIATTEYERPFASIAQKDNFYGVQFHPEKSSKMGSLLLQNFMSL